MKLYHGTSIENANKIFDDGCLKRNCASEYDGVNDFSTNKDYIYFTNNIALAIRCARNSASNQKDKHILIFELDIDRKDLLPDEDELRIATQDLPYIQRSNTPKSMENLIWKNQCTCLIHVV